MIYFKPLTFENFEEVLNLSVNDYQKDFVESPSYTIALAYAAIVENLPGKLFVIYEDENAVGLALYGLSPVSKNEPDIFQKYGNVYRILGFFIDERFQKKGIGRLAFSELLNQISLENQYSNLPVTLEVKEKNKIAQRLYQDFGFIDTNYRYDDDLVYAYFSN